MWLSEKHVSFWNQKSLWVASCSSMTWGHVICPFRAWLVLISTPGVVLSPCGTQNGLYDGRLLAGSRCLSQFRVVFLLTTAALCIHFGCFLAALTL